MAACGWLPEFSARSLATGFKKSFNKFEDRTVAAKNANDDAAFISMVRLAPHHEQLELLALTQAPTRAPILVLTLASALPGLCSPADAKGRGRANHAVPFRLRADVCSDGGCGCREAGGGGTGAGAGLGVDVLQAPVLVVDLTCVYAAAE